jgi:penicillin-binding protein 1C
VARVATEPEADPPRAPEPPEQVPVERQARGPAADTLRLLFPPNGAVLASEGSVTLRAMGRRRPLTFLVDGVSLAAEPFRREAGWLPPGPGFYRVTVVDAAGAAAHASVQVR